MRTIRIIFAALAILASPGGASAETERRAAFPADLGPAAIDVSSYPPRMREIYRDHFLTKCGVCHTPARAINSQFLELDEASLEKIKRERPGFLADPDVLLAGKDVWKIYIKRMKMRPPCCGVCPVLTQEESRDIWEFLTYDSKTRKTGANEAAWREGRRQLLVRFEGMREGRSKAPKGRNP